MRQLFRAVYGEYPESSQAALALIMSMLGFVLCQMFAPIGWVMGSRELRAIAEGRRPPDNKGLAGTAPVTGIIGSVLLVVAVLLGVVFLLMGDFATLDQGYLD